MKNAKYVIIAIACICLICVGFYFFAKDNPALTDAEVTEVEKIILKDLEKDYPKTPREVVKFYNRIITCYYSGEITEEQLGDLVDQMVYLFDDELALINPRDEYYDSVVADIEEYKKMKKTIVNSDVSDSNDVLYIDDKKEGTDNADELAYVDTSYFVNTNGEFTHTYQQFVLRKDEDGRWKILVFYEIEGEPSEDE